MKKYYTLAEVANALECTVQTVYNYEKRGLIQRIEGLQKSPRARCFKREGVDRLIQEKAQLDAAGSSIQETAKRLEVYPQKVKEAISVLNLDVKLIPSNMQAAKHRFAITKEQEQKISDYLKREKAVRIKRNHLYFPELDLALYQSFLVSGKQPVRLKQNDINEVGFFLDSNKFLPYLEAFNSYELEPCYTIHQKRQGAYHGFTDIMVPIEKKVFYLILDALYAVCGVENFNAEIQGGKLFASIRNGNYVVNEFATKTALAALQTCTETGEIESKGGYWIFIPSTRKIQLQFEEAVYKELKGIAETKGLSLVKWATQVLEEQRNYIKK